MNDVTYFKNKQLDDQIDGIKIWAAFNKSDPFAFNVAMSHARNGITGRRQMKCTMYDDKTELVQGAEAFYNGRVEIENHKVLKNDVYVDQPVMSYRSLTRP